MIATVYQPAPYRAIPPQVNALDDRYRLSAGVAVLFRRRDRFVKRLEDPLRSPVGSVSA